MNNIVEYAIVKATKQLGDGVIKDTLGTVLIIYDKPIGYEVEFVDINNESISVKTVTPNDIVIVED